MRRLFLSWLLLLSIAPVASGFDDDPRAGRHPEAAFKAAATDRARRSAARESLDPNQELYDTRYLDIDLGLDPVTETIDGVVIVRVTVVAGPISSLVLDLDQALQVDAVGLAATAWSHGADRLTLTLDRAYATDEDLEVLVEYSGTPDPAAAAFGFELADGKPLIWSLSEPYGARTWLPVKDTPADKADSASIRLTVPEPLIAVSNGTLEQVVDLGAERRYEWVERYPIAIYLISVAAHEYVEQSQIVNTNAGPLTLVNWSYASSAASAASNLGATGQMMLAFEQGFGPYPFMDEKYGQAQFNWGGGMEHQTVTSRCCWSVDFLTAHELGHQWFGDRATCESFTDIWLNEGFATWTEAYWLEASAGQAAYRAEMQAARYLGPGTVRVPEGSLGNSNRIFDSNLSYDKGSWIVHMLRGVMGDPDFFAFLPAYLDDPAVSYGTATTADVQRVAEQVSGLDLQAFFAQWVDEEWYPTYQLGWNSVGAGGGYDLTVELAQLQTHHVFTMPVPIRVTTAGGVVDLVVQSDEPLETALFPLVDEPLAVELDPDGWVLHAEESPVPDPTFHRGLLLVNGVDIDVYGSEIRTALSDSSFTGLREFEYWDLFGTPSGGYPPGLPAPRGEGGLPADVLDDYSTVVWLGNDYNGDVGAWIDAAILDYLEKGGNVVLLSRLGRGFLTQTRLAYLGTDYATTSYRTVNDADAQWPGLVDMGRLNTQSLVDPLITTGLEPETTVLFGDAAVPSWALGIWRQPAGGGSLRGAGGHFVHIAGRPYRWVHPTLRANMEVILTDLLGEPVTATTTPPATTRVQGLTGVTPNPFNPRVLIEFSLREPARVELSIHDLRGRRVRTLLGAERGAGPGQVIWDGRDDSGRAVASGVYTVRLDAGGEVDHEKITLLK